MRNLAKRIPGAVQLYERYHHMRYHSQEYRKERQLYRLARQFRQDIFVETGTFNGDMLYMMRPLFRELYSIELEEERCIKARERFKNCRGVHIHQGDSRLKLEQILEFLDEPAFIYLDAHHSGFKAIEDTPLKVELCSVARYAKPESVVIIDDFPDELQTITRLFYSFYGYGYTAYRYSDFIVIEL